MATHVGTGVAGSSGATPVLFVDTTTPKSVSIGDRIGVAGKWETIGPTCIGATDAIGNDYQIVVQQPNAAGQPSAVILACNSSIGAHASNVVRLLFSAPVTFASVMFESFSGSNGGVDAVPQQNQGTTSPYSTTGMVSTAAGMMFFVVADFNGLTTPAAAGTPAATLGVVPVNGDCFCGFLPSYASGTITPGATAVSGATQWVMLAALFKDAGLVINTQPSDQTVNVGGSATFSVSATASAGSLTYQWQDNSAGGVFANISGATSASLVVSSAAAGQNGRRYRVVVTDSNGSITSASAALIVQYPSRAVVPQLNLQTLEAIGFQSLLDIRGWFAPSGTVGLQVEKWFAEELDAAAGGATTPMTLTSSLPLVAARAWRTNATRSATAGSTATKIATASLIKAAASATSAALVRFTSVIRSTGTATAATIVRSIAATKTASTTLLATIQSIKTKLLTLSASVTALASKTTQAQAIKSASTVTNAATARMAGAIPLAATACSATVIRSARLIKIASTTMSATLAVLKTKLLTLSASVTTSAVVVRSARAIKSAATSCTATVIRSVSIIRSAGLTLIATLAAIKAKFLTLTASVATSATLVRSALATRAAAIVLAATITRRTNATRTASIGSAATLPKVVSAIRTAAVTLVATLSALKTRAMTLSASIGSAVTLVRMTSATRSAATACSASISKFIAQTLTTALTLSPTFNKIVARTLSVGISLLADLATTVQRAGNGLSAQHAKWLEALARVHGLIDPLTVNTTSRTDGALIQTIDTSTPSTVITPIAVPDGLPGDSALTVEQAAWLEGLMRAHGLIDPLTVNTGGRTDGTLTQTITQAGGDVTLTKI